MNRDAHGAKNFWGNSHWRWSREFVIGTMVGAVAFIPVVAPRLTPSAFAVLSTILLIATPAPRIVSLSRKLGQRTVILGGLFGLFGVLSSTWSLNWTAALEQAAIALTLLICTVMFVNYVDTCYARLPDWKRRPILRAFPIAVSAALVIGLFDIYSGNILTVATLKTFPELIGQRGKGLIMQDGEVTGLTSFHSNRNIASLVFLAVPILAGAAVWLEKWSSCWLLMSFLVIGIVAAVFGSESETAKLALIIGVIAYFVAKRWPRISHRALRLILICGILATPLLARLPHSLGVHTMESLPFSFRERVLIWDYTAEAMLKSPWIGVGLKSTPILQEQLEREGTQSDPGLSRRKFGWHAHSFYIGIWFELGLFGALLFLALHLSLLTTIAQLTQRIQPWGFALMIITVASGIGGWNFWQPWFLGVLAASVSYLIIVNVEIALRNRSEAEQALEADQAD